MNLFMGVASGISGGFSTLGASALFKPIAAELGLSRAITSVAGGLSRLEGGIQAPITGVLADKFGPKWLVVAGAFLLGGGLVFMYFIDSAWSYYLAWGVLVATGQNLGFTIAHDKVMTNWFVRKRGLAFGVRFAILGLMGAIMLPIVSLNITSVGWRMTCLIWAMVIFATIPLSMYLVKQNRPEHYGLLPDGARFDSDTEAGTGNLVDKGVEYAAGDLEMEITLRQALKTPAYWLLAIGWITFGMLTGAISLHCIPFLTDVGFTPAVAAGMMAMMSFVQTPARFIAGILTDRVRIDQMHLLMAGGFLIQAVGVAALLLHQTTATIYIFPILFGAGSGAMLPLGIAIRGRYFGRKAYGSIQGSSQLLSAPAALLAPIYAGWVYDVNGTYTTAFLVFGVIVALTGVLMFFLKPPKPPADAYDISKFM